MRQRSDWRRSKTNKNLIKKNDIYYVNNSARAMQIKKSGLAEVEEEIETATKKVKAETAVKKTTRKDK